MTGALPPWSDRPREEGNLFNPAFTSLLVARAVAHHERTGPRLRMPLALSFLVLPIVLHAATRAMLPRKADTNLFAWLSTRPEIKALFPGRAKRLTSVTQEAIRFALTYRKLVVEGDRLASGPKPYGLSSIPSPATDETKDCLQKAAFVGRWFAIANSTANIMGAWGVRP
jgi:ABC-3C biological conflict system middle component